MKVLIVILFLVLSIIMIRTMLGIRFPIIIKIIALFGLVYLIAKLYQLSSLPNINLIWWLENFGALMMVTALYFNLFVFRFGVWKTKTQKFLIKSGFLSLLFIFITEVSIFLIKDLIINEKSSNKITLLGWDILAYTISFLFIIFTSFFYQLRK